MNTIKMWFVMKKKEIEFKWMFYTYGVKFMDEKEDFVKAVWNVYESCKETPILELRDKFIEELAVLAHEAGTKERESASDAENEE